MSMEATRQDQHSGPWRSVGQETTGRAKRFGRRMMAVLLLACLLSAYGYVLVQPFQTRAVHVLTSTARYTSRQDAPCRLSIRQQRQFEQLIGQDGIAIPRRQTVSLFEPIPIEQSLLEWASYAQPDAETTIAFVSAHGVSRDHQAYLLSNSFRPGQEGSQLIPVADLLDALRRTRSRSKLLILDAGGVAWDARFGIASHEFAQTLAKQVRATGDATLSVLLSHSPGEISEGSAELGGSVFTHFLLESLGGAADLDGSGSLELDELAEYVTTEVSSFVWRTSGGLRSQTPLVICVPTAIDAATAPQTTLCQLPRRWPVRARVDRLGDDSAVVDWSAIWTRLQPRYRAWSSKLAGRSGTTASATPAANQASSSERPESTPDTASVKSNDPTAAQGPPAASVDELAIERHVLAEEIVRGWLLYDALNGTDQALQRPQLWRELRQALIGCEQIQRLADKDVIQQARLDLRHDLQDWEAVMDKSAADPIPDWACLQPTECVTLADIMPGSADACPLNYSRPDGKPIAATELYTELLTAIRGGRLATWMTEQWRPEMADVYEFRLARQLHDAEISDAELVILALDTRRAAQQLDQRLSFAQPWIMSRLLAADRVRIAGERYLIQQAAPDWADRASQTLIVAKQWYAQITETGERIKTAIRLRDELLGQAAGYVHWLAEFRGESVWAPSFDLVHDTLRTGSTLADLLESPSPDQLAQLIDVHQALTRSHQTLQAMMTRNLNYVIDESRPQSNRQWLVERFLEIPLAPPAARIKLLRSLREGQVAESGIRSRPRGCLGQPTSPSPAGSPTFSDQMNILQLDLLNLYLPSHSPLRPTIQRLIEDIAQRKPRDSSGANNDLADPSQEADSVAEFYAALYRSLDNAQSVLEGDDQVLVERGYQELARGLHAVDPRDIREFQDTSLATAAQKLRLSRAILLLIARLHNAMNGADAAEREYLLVAADRSSQRLDRVYHDASIPTTSCAATITGPSTVSLTDRDVTTWNLNVRPAAGQQSPGWLVLEYNPQVLEVLALAEIDVYPLHQLGTGDSSQPAAKVQLDQPRWPSLSPTALDPRILADLRSRSATWAFRSGAEERVTLLVRPIGNGPSRSTIVATLVTDAGLVHCATDVQLPARNPFPLVVDGPVSTTPDAATVEFHPYPNRATSFQLSLANRSSQSATVDVMLFPIESGDADCPRGLLSQSSAAAYLSHLEQHEPLAQIRDLVLPVDTTVRLPFPKPAEPPAPAGEAASPAKTVLGQPVALDRGFVVVVFDKQRQRVAFEPVRFRVQRPSRYIAVDAQYDAATRLLSVDLRALDRASVPAEGIVVRAELSDDDPSTLSGNLVAVIKPPTDRAELKLKLPKRLGVGHTIYLHVDDYPRAFVFDIPATHRHGIVLPATDRLAVRIAKPEANVYYGPGTESVPVTLEVDAPPGTFSRDLSNVAGIGLDLDGDRELHDEPQVQVREDRQSRVSFAAAGPNGLFQVKTEVTDHRLEIPVKGVSNASGDLWAWAVADGQVCRDHGTTVVLDSLPPTIRHIANDSSDATAKGQAIEAMFAVDDRDLSGVDLVEGAIDHDLLGQFGETAKPIRAQRGDRSDWTLSVPTDDLDFGHYSLLVRAKDQAGNLSQYFRLPVQVTPATSDGGPSNTIRGSIAFGELSVGDAEVTIQSADGIVLKKVRSEPDGKFVIPKVPVGKHKLTVAGRIKYISVNRELDIDVPSPPNKPKPVSIQVR